MDFAQFRVEFEDEPGVVRILWLFTIILGHSRWIWGRFCATQDLQTVLRCHIDAFAAMDDAPVGRHAIEFVRRHPSLRGVVLA